MSETQADDENVSINEQRARWESFSYRLAGPRRVNIANHSYGDDDAGKHCYTVTIEAGRPVSCSCPHWEHRRPPGGCKHMIAVANNEAVMIALTADETDDEADETDDACPNGAGYCPGLDPQSATERTLQCPQCKAD